LGGKAEISSTLDRRKMDIKGTPVAQMRKKGAEFIISIEGDGTVLRGIQKMTILFQCWG